MPLLQTKIEKVLAEKLDPLVTDDGPQPFIMTWILH